MKSIFSLQTVLLGAAVLAGTLATTPLRAASSATKPSGGELQVYVDVPIPWHPVRQWNLANNLAMLVGDTMHHLGYEGRIVHLATEADARKALPQLTLHLIVWRLDRTRNVECTFGATLRVGHQQRDLGVFSSTKTVVLPDTDGWELSNTVQDAAKAAVKQMCRQVRAAGLLKGFPAKKSKAAA